ncbi:MULTISPECIES: protocatechuate 3,4-dioxygenase subunit alpha [Paracoccus]|uniref:protocatechuate 3,4-dioxygenase subunit alpha n=1 Tax=Paracoccus TaxID=265 RepID=UPI00086E7343|nr:MULTISPECIES: protocatechuate 3,4-dioxygenase subunit alpha [Paracoccus]ODT58108.1 MAG: protocatechuate 3,4-dioxygenase subunit alpha [Paracoccus sp. SCN 68-21]
MPQALPYLRETPSQTAGPYVHIGLAPGAAGFDIYREELGHRIIALDTPGERIRIEGCVFDGTGAPVRDVLIELWQADGQGIHPHPEDPRHADCAPGFRGWARIVPDFDTGLFVIDTIRPGSVPGPNGRPQAPHLSLWLVARGINTGLQTRMYFDNLDNAADPLLALIEQPDRRDTLIARCEGAIYRFDIHLQGNRETVFIDV